MSYVRPFSHRALVLPRKLLSVIQKYSFVDSFLLTPIERHPDSVAKLKKQSVVSMEFYY